MCLRSLFARGLALSLVVGGAAGAAVGVSAAGADGGTAATPLLAAGDALRVAATGDGGKALRTADGRTVRLRGANVNALVDYGGARRTVPVTARDGAQARALGFSVVRLAVSWSRIAPQPGVVDDAYLDEIRVAARAFTDEGVRVLLDLHQDRYAAHLGASGDESDGAPAWASLTGGASTAAGSGGHGYYGTAAARTAARRFFEDATVAGRGLQDHYADALAVLAGVGEELGPGLAGVELYNEPVDPFGTADPSVADTFSPSHLWPFYRRMIARLRGTDGTGPGAGAYDGPIWFEPQATRTMTDDDAVAASFSDDANLVYGPHVYTDVYNGRIGEATVGRLATSFDNAEREARRYGAALAPTELPGAQTGPWEIHRGEVLRHLDRLDAGGMVWVWKQAAGAGDYGWGVLLEDGSVRADSAIARDYGRARVRASSAPVASSTWSAGTLTVRTTGAGTLDLWDGAAFATAAPAAGVAPVVTVDGAAPAAGTLTGRRAAATLQSDAAWVGGRELRLTVPAGEHTVVLRPAGAGESPTPAPAAAESTTTTVPPPTTTTPGETTTPTTTTTVPGTTTTPATTTTPTTTTTPSSPIGGLLDGISDVVGGLVPAATTPVATAVAAVSDPVRALTATLGGLLGGASSALPSAGTAPRGGPPAPATAAPAVASASASPRRFRSATGTTVRASAPTASRVRVALERRTAGRRSRGRCVAVTRRLARAAACRRWTGAVTVTRAVASGRAAVRVRGRTGARALPVGTYRAVVTPLAADGTAGAVRRIALTVLAPAR